MSLLDSLRDSLASMGSLQLLLAFAALLSYTLALSVALPFAVRSMAAGLALVAAVAFASAASRWMDGVVLMSMSVVICGAFAGCSWVLARLLGVGDSNDRSVSDTDLGDIPEGGATGAGGLDAAAIDAALARAVRLSRRAAVHTS